MSEYESRGPSRSIEHASPARSSSPDVIRTPQERALDTIVATAREVDALAHSIELTRRAEDSNEPAAWSEARGRLDRDLANATRAVERARACAADASPDGRSQLARSEHALAQASERAATMTSPPRGWKPCVREADVLATLREPISGPAQAGNDAKERALRAVLVDLDATECAQLAKRLQRAQPGDPLVAEVARMIPARRARLLAFLGDARRRRAQSKVAQKTSPKKASGIESALSTTDIATEGIAGAGERLPHHERIQASFGAHDISGIRAHIAGPAAQASAQLSARAFAFGDHVAFASAPDLHTAAHEAAHHVQQRGGVALKSAIDQPDDEHEQHADRVADAVVRGESAVPLLDRAIGRGAKGGSTTAVVQRKTDSTTASSESAPHRSALSTYVGIHVVDLRVAIERTLVGLAWPDPAPDVGWRAGAESAFGLIVSKLVGARLENGEAALIDLLHPSDVVAYVNRTIDLAHANWSPEFGLGFAGLVATAAIRSLTTRVGPSYRAALARSAEVPTVADLVTAETMDSLVATALVHSGGADPSNVIAEPTRATPRAGKHESAARASARAEVAAASATERVPTRDQLLDIDRKVRAGLDGIRISLNPVGLGAQLDHAYRIQEKRAHELVTADDATLGHLLPLLQFQHSQLLTLGPQIAEEVSKFLPVDLALKVSRDAGRKAHRDLMWSRLTRLVEAAKNSDQPDESSAILRSIGDDEAIEHDANVQASFEAATQPVIAAGHTRPGTSEAQDRIAHQRQATLTGTRTSASKYEREKTDTMAGEVALDSRVDSVKRALVQLQAAAEDAGFADPAKLRKFVPNARKTVPELLADVDGHLSDVDTTWKHATIDGTPAVQEDPDAPEGWTDWIGRAAGLAAARAAFAKIAGDQDIGEFLRDCADKIRHQRMLHAITELANALLITLATGMGAAALGRAAAAAIVAEESSAVATLAAEGATLARAGFVARGMAVAADIGINASINAAVQFVQSDGKTSLGWSMLKNSLGEMFTRGLMGPIRSAQQAAIAEARQLAALPGLSAAERDALLNLDFVGAEMTTDLVAGMATQWAADRIVESAHAHTEVSEPFAATVLEQGAAIALGKFFHGKAAAWQQHRAELERTGIGALPEAHALFAARDRFYARAKALAESASPDPAEGSALQAEHDALLEKESDLVARAERNRQGDSKQEAAVRPTDKAAGSVSAYTPTEQQGASHQADAPRAGNSAVHVSATQGPAETKWQQAVEDLSHGSIPAAGLLPDTPNNRDGLARLADIQTDQTIPSAVRQAFMQDFALRLRALEKPTEHLFNLMKDIVYSHEGGAKYQRKGTKISNLAYVRDELGGAAETRSLTTAVPPRNVDTGVLRARGPEERSDSRQC